MSRRCRQAGFSLLEVVIGMAIFSVGMLAMAGLQTTSIRGNRTAGEMTVVTALGQAEIERLLALPFAAPDLAVTGGQPRSWEAEGYRYRLEVTANDLLADPKTLRLDIEAVRPGRTTRTRLVAVKADVL